MPARLSDYYYDPVWIFGVFLSCIAILGYIYASYSTRLVILIKLVFSFGAVTGTAKNEYALSHPASVLLSVNFVLAFSLFIMQTIDYTGLFSLYINFSPLHFLTICAAIASLFFFKIIVLNLLGYIFKKRQLTDNYSYLIIIACQSSGIFLTCLTIVIAYSEAGIKAGLILGIILISAIAAISAWKAITAALFTNKAKPTYIFLYLCALEILPLLVCIRLFERFA